MPSTKISKQCDVALLVDAETGVWSARGGRFIPARGSVEAHVFKELSRRFVAVVVPFGDWLTTIRTLHALAPKLVFNLTEWINGDRTLDYAIAALLDDMALPYTGTGARGLQLCRDKVECKRIVAKLGVAVPRHFDVKEHRLARALAAKSRRFEALSFPLLVKPRFGDGSDAISEASLVKTPAQLKRRLAVLRRKKLEPLCEEFIAGRDVYVGLLGNAPRVLTPIEMVVMDAKPAFSVATAFATDRVKIDAAYRKRRHIRFQQTHDRKLVAAVRVVSADIFHALELRDYARLDFRLTPEGKLVFIEANPNPDLAPHTFGTDLCFAGVDYATLILRIVRSAMSRRKA